MTGPEREACVRGLRAALTVRDLEALVPRPLRDALPGPEGDAERLARALVDLHGTDLLRDRTVRERLTRAASDDQLQELLDFGGAMEVMGRDHAERLVAARNWHAGKRWARHFVKVMRLPDALQGVPDEGTPAPYELVTPPVPLNPLHGYQVQLKQQLRDILNAPARENRAILSLPTGAGKTRTAVEAIVDEMAQGRWRGATFLWIAQTEELCEQALESFRQVWLDYGLRHAGQVRMEPLRLCRVWGSRRVPEAVENGVMIAGIDKLRSLIDRLEPQVEAFFDGVDAVVIDEAHRAMAPEYTRVLGLLKMRALDHNERPLIGLTATPYRTSAEESKRLVRRFGETLLRPPWPDPMRALREEGILSRIQAQQIKTRHVPRFDLREEKQAREFRILPPTVALRVGRDKARNELMLQHLLAIPHGQPTLVFTCSVEHAHILTVLLRSAGRSAAAISAETPRSLRRTWIEHFRQGEIQFLCNFDILTTGFDAPRVEVVVVGRPTSSELVYEQMIGRGMRGPRNNGTEVCTIIDFVDAITAFGEPMSYARYETMWRQYASGDG